MKTGRTAAGLWKDLELSQAEARVQGPRRARRRGNRQRCPFLEMLVKEEDGGTWAGRNQIKLTFGVPVVRSPR